MPDDVSIIIAYNKKEQDTVDVSSLLALTNMNVLPFAEEIPAEIITFLDPTVETLSFEQQNAKMLIHLKFIGREDNLPVRGGKCYRIVWFHNKSYETHSLK